MCIRDRHEAAGVGRDEHLGLGLQDIRRLAVTELACGDRVQDVVDSRGTAAEVRVGDLAQLKTGYAGKQLSRLGADALGVPEVTGIVVGDRHRTVSYTHLTL